MQSDNPLPRLINGALAQGVTRADLMRLAECSRQQLWRLERGLVSEESKTGARLIAALRNSDLSSMDQALSELSQRLKSVSPERRNDAISMLQSVTKLLG